MLKTSENKEKCNKANEGNVSFYRKNGRIDALKTGLFSKKLNIRRGRFAV